MMPSQPAVEPIRSITISNDEVNLLPLGSYKGKVVVITTPNELNKVAVELNDQSLIGFDTETKPSFKRGEFHKIALIQLAIADKVFLIQVQKTGLPDSLSKIFSDPNIIKTGVAIRDDIKGLQKYKRFNPAGFVDLSLIAREKGIGVESVKKLTALLLGFRISKSAQTSNWEATVLNDKQIEYAATDAWVCLEIYKKLCL